MTVVQPYRGAIGREQARGAGAQQLNRGRQVHGDLLASALDVPINSLRPSSAARGMSAVTRYGYSKYSALFGSRQRHNYCGVSACRG